jgi:hypothetical protein
MELFKLTTKETGALREQTIEQMLDFNRQIKVDYSRIKADSANFK